MDEDDRMDVAVVAEQEPVYYGRVTERKAEVKKGSQEAVLMLIKTQDGKSRVSGLVIMLRRVCGGNAMSSDV